MFVKNIQYFKFFLLSNMNYTLPFETQQLYPTTCHPLPVASFKTYKTHGLNLVQSSINLNGITCIHTKTFGDVKMFWYHLK